MNRIPFKHAYTIKSGWTTLKYLNLFSAERGEESLGESSLDVTLREETTAEAEPVREVRFT